MARNLMPEIAKLLGVELEERFKIKSYIGEYYLSDGGIYTVDVDEDFNGILMSLLRGTDEIIKKPWKPRFNERYYAITGMSDHEQVISQTEVFTDCMCDYMNYATGNCFKTKEEAELHKRDIFEKLKNQYKEEIKYG